MSWLTPNYPKEDSSLKKGKRKFLKDIKYDPSMPDYHMLAQVQHANLNKTVSDHGFLRKSLLDFPRHS